jgi:signal transduction histidine kinase
VAVHAQRDADSGAVLLDVDDSGPGLGAADRERAFDRFWRREADAAAVSGSGLGLAIVKTIAERHRAQVTLGEAPLGGLRVRVRFKAGDRRPAS